MSETITLTPHQTHVLKQGEFASFPNITVNGPGNSSVVANGNFALDNDSLTLTHPTLRGHGLLDLGDGGKAELGAVSRGETVKIDVNSGDLQLDKPLQFLGKVDFGPLPPNAPGSANAIDLPNVNGFDHATFHHHELKLYDVNDTILAKIKIVGVDAVFVRGGAGTEPIFNSGTSVTNAVPGDERGFFTLVHNT